MEELKLILEAIETIGQGASYLFVVYIVKGFLQFALGMFVIVFIVTKIIKTINKSSYQERISNAIGIYLDEEKKHQLLDYLRKHSEDIYKKFEGEN